MLRERIVWIVALLVVAGVGFYSGQLVGTRTAIASRAAAASQFFSQRGGGQGGQGSQGNGQGSMRGGGTVGTVSDISGNTITITTRNGQAVKVALAANATIHKQADAQLSDITKGEQIIATGTQNGDTLQATNIQIGVQAFGGGQGAPSNGQGGQGNSNAAP